MLFASVFSVTTGVGGCEWPISDGAVCMDIVFWQFSNNPPNSASVLDTMTFLIMMNYTCNGPFYGGIAFISVLDFDPRKKYPSTMLCASGSDIFKMHTNICGELFLFFCIMLLHLDVTRCNLKI